MKQSKVRSEAQSLSGNELRGRLILERPAAVGAKWALASLEDATSSGRRIEGGWPGTVPEARVRVLQGMTQELASLGLAPLSQTELTSATAAAYERAKRDWQLAGKAMSAKSSASSKSIAR